MTREVDSSTKVSPCCEMTALADGFTIVYELLIRQNEEAELGVMILYDIIITKRLSDGTVCSSACLSAVSSVYERAYRMFLCAYKNTVTPVCAADFFEEYNARLV